jgi:hypothetical protein
MAKNRATRYTRLEETKMVYQELKEISMHAQISKAQL